MTEIQHWNIAKSKSLYGIENWGAGYYDINENGHIAVKPNGPDGPTIDLYELVQAAKERRIATPVLFRFNGILRHRIKTIYHAFQAAIKEFNYQGNYFPAYPIKVNQQRHIVEVLRKSELEFPLGLEVGSKPELIAVLGIQDNDEALLLCNGYKDASYIELALMSKKIGRKVVIIIEKVSELPLVLDIAEKMQVEADIGLRLKLSGKGAGRWERSGGDRAKFGLTIGEVLHCIEQIKEHGKLHTVRLLHFHAGSQLTSISKLGTALKEAGQVYVQLKKNCPNLDFIDVGGGLGVDYDGSKTSFSSSMNYTVEEYARDVVWILDDICAQGKVPHPHIITESGRATVAYHCLLIFDVLGIANTFTNSCDPDEILRTTEQATVKNLAYLLKEVNPKNCQEAIHDAIELRNDMVQQFNLGLMTIEERAKGDQCYWAVLSSVCRCASELHYVPEDLERLPTLLTDTYFCNLSIFQSLPDAWAIQQIFPIMPLHRLTEEPTVPVVLADITCDSDGLIDRFPDLRDVKRYLQAHKLLPEEPYYFVTFLVGAYQETLGDLHNLFGDNNAVHIEVSNEGQIEFSNVVLGDSIGEVLHYVQFEKESLCEGWRSALEQAVINGKITAAEYGAMYRQYSRAFEGYTYLG